MAYLRQGKNRANFMEYLTNSADETQKLAGRIASDLLSLPTQGALVLALAGELGAGKTVFTQGLGETLGIKERILSPTFVIMKHFEMAASDRRAANSGSKITDLYHLDCYRIEKAGDLAGLGLEEVLQDKKNLVVIEWAERVKDILPPDTVWIRFEHSGGDKRRIEISYLEKRK